MFNHQLTVISGAPRHTRRKKFMDNYMAITCLIANMAFRVIVSTLLN